MRALPAPVPAPARLQIIHPSELMETNARTLAAILDALAELGARHALIGGLVAGYYGKGRATVDVADIVRVLEKQFGPEDEALAADIVGKMYPGAVADLEELLDDVRHGRRPKI
jgi:hypothetical protein